MANFLGSYIGSPPDQFIIPVTLGADREFTLNRVDVNNNAVDWAAQVFIAIDIPGQAQIEATVTGNQAVILLPGTVCDQVKPTTRWRLYMQTTTGSGTFTTPIAVGAFERDDGGR